MHELYAVRENYGTQPGYCAVVLPAPEGAAAGGGVPPPAPVGPDATGDVLPTPALTGFCSSVGAPLQPMSAIHVPTAIAAQSRRKFLVMFLDSPDHAEPFAGLLVRLCTNLNDLPHPVLAR